MGGDTSTGVSDTELSRVSGLPRGGKVTAAELPEGREGHRDIGTPGGAQGHLNTRRRAGGKAGHTKIPAQQMTQHRIPDGVWDEGRPKDTADRCRFHPQGGESGKSLLQFKMASRDHGITG